MAVDTAGDGFLATFDGPGRAIRCACAIRDQVASLGLEVRAGIHTGECHLYSDTIRGIAVHIGARVASAATPSEVLVSSTVKDLVAGSGITFATTPASTRTRRFATSGPGRSPPSATPPSPGGAIGRC